MNFENIEEANKLCARIKALQDKLEHLRSGDEKVLILSCHWDGLFPIHKQWIDEKRADFTEDGLYTPCIKDFIKSLIAMTEGRLDFLHSELRKL